MENIKNFLGKLYKGDKEGAKTQFDSILKDKTHDALQIKKVAVTSGIFNKKG
jgi:hypothetical protein